MSLQAMLWVMYHSRSEHGARLVALSLANHAGGDGSNTHPSNRTIQRETRLGETAVREGVRQLLELGEILETGAGPHGTRAFRFPHVTEDGAPAAAATPPAPAPVAAATVLEQVLDVLRACPQLQIEEYSVGAALRAHPNADHLAAAHTVASWAHEGGLQIRAANRLLLRALERQHTEQAARDAEVKRRTSRPASPARRGAAPAADRLERLRQLDAKLAEEEARSDAA